ncbi:MAG: EAL domain-containing protein [Pseudomonadota bacterium]|nr:EAL domain-containing protein [Pseudomonadota bacterium]
MLNLNAEAILEKVFEGLDEAVILVDTRDRTISGANPAAQRMFGYAPEELIGQSTEILHLNHSQFELFGEQGEPILRAGGVFRCRFTMKHRDGSPIPTENTVVLIRGDDDEPLAAVSVVRDMTEWTQVTDTLNLREQQLQESQNKYRTLIEQIPAVTYTCLPDDNGTTLYISPQIESLLGYSPTQWLSENQSWLKHIHPDDRDNVLLEYNQLKQTHHAIRYRYRMISQSGNTIWVEDHARIITDPDGNPALIQGILTDISELMQLTDALRHSREMYHSIVNNAHDAIAIVQDGMIRFANRKATELIGYSQSELSELNLQDLVAAEDWLRVKRYHNMRMAGESPAEDYCIRILRRDGDFRWVHINIISTQWEGVPAAMGFFTDITQQVRAEEQLRYLEEHDPLTGLPNRKLLLDRIDQAIGLAKRHRQIITIYYINIDHFQLINETQGHEQADKILVELTGQFQDTLRQGDTICRLAGDEFAILTLESHSHTDQETVIKKLHEVCSRLREKRQLPYITLSIGVAGYPQDDYYAAGLLKKASIAMDHAKLTGRNIHCFFDQEMETRSTRRAALQADLLTALPRREFMVYLQPKLSLADNRICGAEALIRWQHPGQGLVQPGEFIDELEATGMIVEVGQWQIDHVCELLSRWQTENRDRIPIAINISQKQWTEPAFAQQVFAALEKHHLPPHTIELEITESIHLSGAQGTRKLFDEFLEHGIGIAIDDFGTGYSSLGYLSRFRVSTLKIDRSFIHDLTTSDNSQALAQAIIGMGRSLGMKVVAEGVETAEQLEILRQMDCDQIQGFYVARPMPIDKFEAFLHSFQSPVTGSSAPVRR